MSRAVERMAESGVVAVVRAPDAGGLVEVLGALADGGVTAAEVTFTVPDAAGVIRDARRQLGGRVLVGAGTVLDPETARVAILAGAEFVVSPVLNLDVVRLCKRYGVAVLPGAYTPTEILLAWEAGADVVKVFPADALGPGYLRAVRGPLPQVRLMPTGGVTLGNAGEFVRAGAVCLGVGGQLVEPAAVAARDLGRLAELARQFADAVRGARKSGRQ